MINTNERNYTITFTEDHFEVAFPDGTVHDTALLTEAMDLVAEDLSKLLSDQTVAKAKALVPPGLSNADRASVCAYLTFGYHDLLPMTPEKFDLIQAMKTDLGDYGVIHNDNRDLTHLITRRVFVKALDR